MSAKKREISFRLCRLLASSLAASRLAQKTKARIPPKVHVASAQAPTMERSKMRANWIRAPEPRRQNSCISLRGTERRRNQAAHGDSQYDTIQSVCFRSKMSSDLKLKRGRRNHFALLLFLFEECHFFSSPRRHDAAAETISVPILATGKQEIN